MLRDRVASRTSLLLDEVERQTYFETKLRDQVVERLTYFEANLSRDQLTSRGRVASIEEIRTSLLRDELSRDSCCEVS